MSNLTRHTFQKGIKRRIQTENLAKKSHKQFYILLNTNQTKLYTYSDLLKENPLPRKFLSSVSRAYILLFSMTISVAIVIKATKYSTY